MKDDLRKLGLTYNETKVYLSLLELGETPVGGVVNDLKVHRQIVYNALDSLEKRGMVSKTMKNNVNHFKVADPKIIIENAEKQELIAKRLTGNIRKEMKKSRREHQISVFDGQKKFQKWYIDKYSSLPKDSIFYIIGGSTKEFEEVMTPSFLYGVVEKIRKKRNLISKNLLTQSSRNIMEKPNSRFISSLRESRYLPFNLENPVSTLIWPEDVSFQFFGKDSPPFIIEIKDKNFRDANLEYFKMLWKMAER